MDDEWAMEMQMGGDGGSIWVLWSEMMGGWTVLEDGAWLMEPDEGQGRRIGICCEGGIGGDGSARGRGSRICYGRRRAWGIMATGSSNGGCGGWMMMEHHTGAPCSGGVPYMVYLQM
ncbi:hypothetical protein ACLOJK_030022 [Asimina triloba]